MDDIFAEQAQLKESDGKVQSRERGQAIREHKMIDKVLKNCNWCFDSKEMIKHLVVAIGNKVGIKVRMKYKCGLVEKCYMNCFFMFHITFSYYCCLKI